MDDKHIDIRWLLAGSKLTRRERALVSAHVKRCRYCQDAVASVAMMEPEPRRVNTAVAGPAAAIALALAVGFLWSGGKTVGLWSVVDAPVDAGSATERSLIASAGRDRLTIQEADVVATIGTMVQLELGLMTAVAGDVADKHAAIIAACEALQQGDAVEAFAALHVFATDYDATGTPLRAVAGYAAGEPAAVVEGLFRAAGPGIGSAAGIDRSLVRAAAWFAAREASTRGDHAEARRLWERIATAPGPDRLSRLAEAALLGPSGRR